MDNLRITSGKYRGQKIKSPKSALTHPMGSREKIALFNMISLELPNSSVLDAYAGSGALGFEAISRGAKDVTFIEKSPKIVKIIQENQKTLGITDAKIYPTSVENFKTDQKYNIIIADPPYDNFNLKALEHLTNFLKDDGVLVLSHPSPTPVITNFNLTKTHKYANANVSIYQKSA